MCESMSYLLPVLLVSMLLAGGGAYAQPLLIAADDMEPMKVLSRFLQDTAGYRVRLVEPGDMPASLSSFYAVFQYIHGQMDATIEHALIDYTRAGGRCVLLHHGIASARWKNPDFLKFTGIHLAPRDDPDLPWRVLGNTTHTIVNLQPEHYITTHGITYDKTVTYVSSDTPSAPREFPAFDLPDTEVFLNQQFTDGRAKTVLLGFRCTDSETGRTIMQDRSMWYKRSGQGWIFYLQPGHAVSDYKNRNICQLIWNCLTWEP